MLRGSKVFRERRVPKDLQGRVVRLGPPVHQEPTGSLVHKVLSVNQDPPELMVSQGLQEQLVLREQRDLRDPLDQTGTRDQQGRRVPRATPVPREPRVIRGSLD